MSANDVANLSSIFWYAAMPPKYTSYHPIVTYARINLCNSYNSNNWRGVGKELMRITLTFLPLVDLIANLQARILN